MAAPGFVRRVTTPCDQARHRSLPRAAI